VASSRPGSQGCVRLDVDQAAGQERGELVPGQCRWRIGVPEVRQIAVDDRGRNVDRRWEAQLCEEGKGVLEAVAVPVVEGEAEMLPLNRPRSQEIERLLEPQDAHVSSRDLLHLAPEGGRMHGDDVRLGAHPVIPENAYAGPGSDVA
jgi:hypothetical protein